MIEGNSDLFWGGQARSMRLLTQLLQYGVAFLSVVLALAINLVFHSHLESTPTPVFFAAVMVSTWYGGLGPGLLATALSTLAVNYFYIEPLYSLHVNNFAYLARLSVFVMAALLINSLNQAQRSAQRRAEDNLQALRESEARLGRLVESNVIGTIVADLGGVILDANDNFLRLVGYTQEELRSGRLCWREMTAPESLEVSERAVQDLMTTGTCQPFEKEYIRKDGSRVPVLHGAVMTGENTVMGFVLDISDRKRVENSLQRTNQTLQTLLDSCPVAIAFFDPQGIVKLWNRAAEQIFGWSATEAIGQFMPTVPHRRDEFLASIQAVLSGRSLNGFEAQHQRKNGQRVDLEIWANLTHDAEGNPGCLGIAWDITERKRAEEALRYSEARFQVLVSNMPGMVYRYAPSGDGSYVFTYISSGSYELTELEPETILQDTGAFFRLIHPEDGSSFEESVAIAVQNSAVWRWEGRIITPSGQLKWIQGRSRPQDTEYGKAWDGLFFDVTERHQAEEALRQSEERLRVALATSPITVFNQDQELRYTWIYNPALDFDAMDVIGKQDEDLFPSSDAAKLSEIKRRVLATGIGLREEVNLTMQGQGFYYDMTVEPLPDVGGKLIGITCACIDITDRKQMELALRQSETTLNALIASSPIGIAFFDRELRYIHVNEALAATNGIPLNEHLGRTLWDVLPKWAPVVAPILQQVMDTQAPLLDQEVVGVTHPSDVVRHGLVNYFPVCLPDGEVLGVGVTSVDITDRRRIEESLRQSEERYRAIYNQVLIGISQADLTGMIISANERFCEIVGRSPDELLTLRMQDLTHPEDLPANLVLFQQMLRDGTSFEIEKRYIRPDGSEVWVRNYVSLVRDAAGQPQCGVAVTEDITERRQTEASLRDSEERLRMALTSANQGLYDFNVQTGEAIVSSAYAEMLGYDPAEFQETHARWRDRLHPDDVALAHQVYEDYVAGKLDSYRVECRQRTQSGDWKWILSVGKIVEWDSEGNPLRMLGTHTDITERKQAEAEREQLLAREQAAREEAETANRIKDEFLAVLSHELRSPLNPILGWSKLLQTQKLDEQRTQHALATIERNAKLQTQLIEDLLDVSRILRGKLVLNIAPVNLVSTIEAALETVRLAVDAKAIEVRFDGSGRVDEWASRQEDGSSSPPPPLQVMGDAARLQQVVWNLLTNAVKFTPAGGQVEVIVERHEDSQVALLEAGSAPHPTHGYAQIQVKDTGKGISPNFLPHVFDYFRQEDGTTTRQFGGLGLGLAIVRHITELHGGTVWAESPGEGLGATFTVRLPLLGSRDSGARTRENANSPRPTSYSPLAGVRILVVDDDADIRELIQFILQQAGAEAWVGASATEALQQVAAFSPAVLISDIGMADMDGYMLMRHLRTLSPEGTIPAIALTAYAGELDQQQAIAAGFQMHLAKPIEPETLIEAIVTLIHDPRTRQP